MRKSSKARPFKLLSPGVSDKPSKLPKLRDESEDSGYEQRAKRKKKVIAKKKQRVEYSSQDETE